MTKCWGKILFSTQTSRKYIVSMARADNCAVASNLRVMKSFKSTFSADPRRPLRLSRMTKRVPYRGDFTSTHFLSSLKFSSNGSFSSPLVTSSTFSPCNSNGHYNQNQLLQIVVAFIVLCLTIAIHCLGIKWNKWNQENGIMTAFLNIQVKQRQAMLKSGPWAEIRTMILRWRGV